MKRFLLIISLTGLTACTTNWVKNESGSDISVNGSNLANGQCGDYVVFLGFIGDTAFSFKTAGDTSAQIGDKEDYPAGHYVVSGTGQTASAVVSKDSKEDLKCPADEEQTSETGDSATEPAGDESSTPSQPPAPKHDETNPGVTDDTAA